MNSASTPAAVDRVDRAANPGIAAALLVVCLCGAVAALLWLPGELGVKAMSLDDRRAGDFRRFLDLLYAFGQLQFAGRAGRYDTTKAIADSNSDGLIVTDAIRASFTPTRPIARFPARKGAADLGRSSACSPARPRCPRRSTGWRRPRARAIARVEELRLAPPLSGEGAAAWYRIRVRPLERRRQSGATLWTVADITRERERHESFFQDLQHAIDYLDHAPAGFFSAEPDGSIAYMNATLADWLDYDIAQFAAGQLKLSDIVAADGASLLSRRLRPTRRSEDRALRRRSQAPARAVPARPAAAPRRLFQRRAARRLAHPGRSTARRAKTRAKICAPPRSASRDSSIRRRWRSPRSIRRAWCCAPTAPSRGSPARAQGGRGEAAPSIYRGLAERDHPLLREAIAAAGEGKGDIAPVDIALEGEGERSARFFLSAADPQGDEGASAFVFALDTTEQRTLQENFVQSQKMQAIGQLAGGIAHDFNNVLTAIIGYSDLLLANHRPTDPSFQDIMQIRQNANRAAGLVRQLLAFSRRQTLRPQTLQLGEVLSELQMLLRRLVGETIELEVVHGRDLWLVKADLNQFEQVIINLVVNARDAMNEGGRIAVRTRNVAAADCAAFNEKALLPADYVLIEVEDTGHGIPTEVRDKIFEPFFTTKEVGKGTGLGLSMVYGIVKQTGGYVFYESEPGVGTTFRIVLPRHIPEPVAEPAKKEAAKPAADLTGHGAILLVEDEEAVRSFASRALASRGYTVLEAETGGDALRVVERAGGKIDLIVSDVIMPEMDGPTMLTELRRRGLNAKVIFVSGYADDAFAKNLPEGQEFLFLPKPFTLKQLVETVKSAMS